MVKNQTYDYHSDRHYFDAETYAFNTATSAIDRDRFAVTHRQHVFGDNTDLVWDSRLFGMDNRLAAQLQASRNQITFLQHAGGFPEDTVAVVDPSPGVYGPIAFDTRNSRLDTIALSFEDRLKLTPAFALIGGVRLEDLTLARNGINADGTIPDGQPFTKTWHPISYRAAYTWEPIRKLTFYSMVATAYDPAAAGIFSISPANSVQLTSARIYETGVKQLFWNDQAEWTLSAYDVLRKNVYVQTTATTFSLAGLVQTKGVGIGRRRAPGREPEAVGQYRPDRGALPQLRFRRRLIYGQHTVGRRAGYHQCRRVVPFRKLGMAGGDRRIGAPCRRSVCFRGRCHHDEGLYGGRRVSVRRCSEMGVFGRRAGSAQVPRSQSDQCGLRGVGRPRLSGSDLPRRAAELRGGGVVQMVTGDRGGGQPD
jgi:hypothetical protein